MSADTASLVTHFAFLLGGYVLGALSAILGRVSADRSSIDRHSTPTEETHMTSSTRKNIEIDDSKFVTSLDDSLKSSGVELGTVVSKEDDLTSLRNKLAQMKNRS